MFKKDKNSPSIDKEQLELIENAQHRVKQKKRLYTHFILFLMGSITIIIANALFNVGENFKPFGKDWFVTAIPIWFGLLLYHVFNVFITNKFMGKAWEKKQIEKLATKQKDRIEILKKEFEKEAALQAESEIFNHNQISKKKTELTIIAAAAENNALGKDNQLIWHLSDDLKRFKQLTNGHYIIMGRKTFESFPKPLPNRTHVVITNQKDYLAPEGVFVVHSLDHAIKLAQNDTQPFIIGGGEIYKQALAQADKIELTRVHATFEADTFFPEIDPLVWKETKNSFHKKDENNEHEFSFITYERI